MIKKKKKGFITLCSGHLLAFFRMCDRLRFNSAVSVFLLAKKKNGRNESRAFYFIFAACVRVCVCVCIWRGVWKKKLWRIQERGEKKGGVAEGSVFFFVWPALDEK